MNLTLHGVMAYEDGSILKLVKEKWNFTAHVRVNDPLAGGIKELKRSPFTKPTKSKKTGIMNPTLLNDRSLTESSIHFAFRAPAARQVSLAGDFNNWDPKTMRMRKAADGVWHLNVLLKPGHHEYRFYADGAWLDDPTAQQRAANAMGGENCVKTIAG